MATGSLRLSQVFINRICRTRPLTASIVRYSSSSGGKDDDNDRLAASVDPGLRLGDYPVLPWRSAQHERPRGWWDDQDRRDKETPLHEEDEALNMWMYDEIENNGKYTRWQALGQLLVAFSLLGGVAYLSFLYDAPSRNPAVPRQYPYNNLYLERGGDPNEMNEKLAKEAVHAVYGEITS